MGHGDELVLVDAYYPSHSKNPTVIRCDGVGGAELLDGIMALMNPDDYVAAPIIMMEPANGDPLDPSVEADFRAHYPPSLWGESDDGERFEDGKLVR